MARTKASVGAKVSSSKSSKARCCAAPSVTSSGTGDGSGTSKSISGGGGNPVCPRQTPKWQKSITKFFVGKSVQRDDGYRSCDELSPETNKQKSKPKRNIIESDDECETQTECNTSLPLEPLNGENSHKIEEFYPKNAVKGKGVGKKSTNKENDDGNTKRESVKRDLEDIAFGEESEQGSKRIKVDC